MGPLCGSCQAGSSISLEPGDFTIGLTKRALKRAVHLFRTKQCGYIDKEEERITCAEVARRDEKWDKKYSRQFQSMLRKINRWKRQDAEKLFNLAYLHGRAAIAFLMHLWKPKDFAIWNGSVDKGLKKLKVKVPRPFSKNRAQGYVDRMAALFKLMQMTGLKSFQSVDHFVVAFGKGHLKF